MNYFSPKTAAERYAKGRPAFHSNTIKHIREYLQPDRKFDTALDIACGTGLSTRALLEIADQVYGTDASAEMLQHAAAPDKIRYAMAPAEQQPFADDYFDLVTVSSGVHWFAIDQFLTEARRILKPGAWLVLYENYFIAEMEGHPDFTQWFRGVYLQKFPSPPRNNDYPWNNENLAAKNFTLVREERFNNPIVFTKQQLILYFTTQSNIIAAVENKATTYEQAEAWLDAALTPFFDDDHSPITIQYGNWIKFIRRAD